jgi:hypothetical protein
MPNKRDLRLDEYEIGVFAYRELNNFCKQYREKKKKLRELESPYKSPKLTGLPSGSGPSDPTGRIAERAAVLSQDIDMIERAANKAAGRDAQSLLKNVTLGIAWEYLPVSCGRRKFYDMRRLFFYLLALDKGYV